MKVESAPSEGFVAVMVPQAYVMDVYAFIAQLEGKLEHVDQNGQTGSSEVEAPDRVQARERDWDAELVKRSWVESPRSMKLVLRHLADAADEWIPIDRLASVAYPDTGNRRQLAGALGAWGHRCSSRYKVETKPFEVQWNHDVAMYEYRMERRFAEIYRPHFD